MDYRVDCLSPLLFFDYCTDGVGESSVISSLIPVFLPSRHENLLLVCSRTALLDLMERFGAFHSGASPSFDDYT
jgi:hypothetical protein